MKNLERLNETIYIVNDNEIEEDILKTIIEDYFRDETTSPKGVEPRVHIRENKEEGTYEVWTWGTLGRFPKLLESFETEDESEEYQLECWLYNFDNDDGSGLDDAPVFFFDKEEAENFMG